MDAARMTLTPAYTDTDVDIYHGDALTTLAKLDAGIAHTCITSPPYYGLRDYGTGDTQIGLEDTPDAYIERLVAVFRQVRRVLRPDGTLWLNLGDSYTGNPSSGAIRQNDGLDGAFKSTASSLRERNAGSRVKPGKSKDLLGIPWRVALALQADGWYLRSDIIWHKPNPMPESVTDRPTKAHEYLFLLTKSPTYFYDHEAIREDAIHEGRVVKAYGAAAKVHNDTGSVDRRTAMGLSDTTVAGRNKRTVWTVAAKPYTGAHFAVFPPALIEPCIMAGTSDAGCCSACGAPRDRQIIRESLDRSELPRDHPEHRPRRYDVENPQAPGAGQRYTSTATVGWKASCECGAPDAACVVLDPFMGSGTTAHTARRLHRSTIGVELNAEYIALAASRLRQGSIFADAMNAGTYTGALT